ncbi:hypothetical protein AYL99_11674 [Fonsecaea erecta]|uniref:Uncharacterized protein n=1 Tax=Fonsecaea erecta TaxID=1367422 RepID=A0A178Z2W2_9EURO|nr:hypothetical protein AYL99_11674 [Fonsecaea erecta]OAP54139.1 hypothetical protein AYL99_11674 [Fonsecaea erecta]
MERKSLDEDNMESSLQKSQRRVYEDDSDWSDEDWDLSKFRPPSEEPQAPPGEMIAAFSHCSDDERQLTRVEIADGFAPFKGQRHINIDASFCFFRLDDGVACGAWRPNTRLRWLLPEGVLMASLPLMHQRLLTARGLANSGCRKDAVAVCTAVSKLMNWEFQAIERRTISDSESFRIYKTAMILYNRIAKEIPLVITNGTIRATMTMTVMFQNWSNIATFTYNKEHGVAANFKLGIRTLEGLEEDGWRIVENPV